MPINCIAVIAVHSQCLPMHLGTLLGCVAGDCNESVKVDQFVNCTIEKFKYPWINYLYYVQFNGLLGRYATQWQLDSSGLNLITAFISKRDFGSKRFLFRLISIF